MIESATYSDGQRTATLSVERIDTWQEDTEVILNFPHVVELADNCLFMRFSRSQHAIADEEPHRDVFSTDDGESWGDAPPGMEFGGGSLGYLRDGTIMRLEHNTVGGQRGAHGTSTSRSIWMQRTTRRFWCAPGAPTASPSTAWNSRSGCRGRPPPTRLTPRFWTSTTAACSLPWRPRWVRPG